MPDWFRRYSSYSSFSTSSVMTEMVALNSNRPEAKHRQIHSDLVWKEFGPTTLQGLKPKKPATLSLPCISITSGSLLSESQAERSRDLHDSNEDEWEKWRTRDVPHIHTQPVEAKDALSLLICPRPPKPTLHPSVPNRRALATMPVQKDRFEEVLTRLHVPDAFLDIIFRPRPLFKKMKSYVNDQQCEVYMLCVDSSLINHTAICITYFPASHQVFGLYLGYSSKEDVSDIILRLRNNMNFTGNPFVLIACFLELERRHRTFQLDDMVSDLHKKIWRTSKPQTSKDQDPRGLENGDNMEEQELYGISMGFTNVKMQLILWISQLEKLQKVCGEFPEFSTTANGGFRLDPDDYVADMVSIFTERKLRCDRFLEDLSLLFQKDLADASRRDARAAISDARQMKAIAVLTMVLLPATAVATFMDAPIYEWGDNAKHWFWGITGVLTTIVLICYSTYVFYVRSESRK